MTASKRCTKCGVEKPVTLEFFGPDKRARDNLESACRECARERLFRWRVENLEKERARLREYNAANPEKRRESGRRCRAAHPEKHHAAQRRWSEANREKIRKKNLNYCASHPEKVNAKAARRRALKRNALDPSANHEAIAALHAEAKMAEAFMGSPFAVDHIVPLARGGKHHEDNLRSLPSRLNSIKGSKLDHEVTDADFKAWIHPSPTFERVIPHGCLPCILKLRAA